MNSKKNWLLILSLCFLIPASPAFAQGAIPTTTLTNKRVLWLGDSITQLGGYV